MRVSLYRYLGEQLHDTNPRVTIARASRLRFRSGCIIIPIRQCFLIGSRPRAFGTTRNRELFRTAKDESRRYHPQAIVVVVVVVVVVVNDVVNCATKNAASQLIRQFRQARSLGQLPGSKVESRVCVPSEARRGISAEIKERNGAPASERTGKQKEAEKRF